MFERPVVRLGSLPTRTAEQSRLDEGGTATRAELPGGQVPGTSSGDRAMEGTTAGPTRRAGLPNLIDGDLRQDARPEPGCGWQLIYFFRGTPAALSPANLMLGP